MFNRFDTIPECHGRMDGRNCHVDIARCIHEWIRLRYENRRRESNEKVNDGRNASKIAI